MTKSIWISLSSIANSLSSLWTRFREGIHNTWALLEDLSLDRQGDFRKAPVCLLVPRYSQVEVIITPKWHIWGRYPLTSFTVYRAILIPKLA